MKAEQVVEKILSQARQEAESILNETRSKIEARRAALQTELADYAKQTDEQAQAAAADKLSRMMAAARMDLRKRTLAAKVELLDELFEQARQRINALPDEAYLALMGKLLTQAVQTGDEEVIVGKNETRLNYDFIKQVNKKLGPGFKGNLRMSTTKADIDGGFILRRGKVQVNASTRVLIDQVRETMEANLVADLFAE